MPDLIIKVHKEGRDENRLYKSGPDSDDIGESGGCRRLLFRPVGSLPLRSQARQAIPKILDDHAGHDANDHTQPIERNRGHESPLPNREWCLSLPSYRTISENSMRILSQFLIFSKGTRRSSGNHERTKNSRLVIFFVHRTKNITSRERIIGVIARRLLTRAALDYYEDMGSIKPTIVPLPLSLLSHMCPA